MEILAGKWKTVFGCVPHLNFAFWGMVTALVAYLVPDWRHMEIIFSVPLVALYAVYWVLPESPRYTLLTCPVLAIPKQLRSFSDLELLLTFGFSKIVFS